MSILVVEDELSMAALPKPHLTEEDYSVVGAVDGAAGLGIARNEQFDVTVLDLMFTKMDGFTAAKLLQPDENQTPVPMHTAKDATQDVVTGLNSGAEELPKILGRFYSAGRFRNRSAGCNGPRLAVAQLTADKHSAKIEISSSVGAGSAFRIYFPGPAAPEKEPLPGPRCSMFERNDGANETTQNHLPAGAGQPDPTDDFAGGDGGRPERHVEFYFLLGKR